MSVNGARVSCSWSLTAILLAIQHTKSFARRREAESFARQVEVEKEDGRWSDPAAGRVTVGVFWNHFLDTSHHLRPTTRALYETTASTSWKRSEIGSSVRKPDVKEFVSDLVQQGEAKPRWYK